MINIEKIKSKKTIQELLEFGIVNIDKSSGPTSFDTSDFVRQKLGLRKTSHFGTLDPKVTGVLPIALNRACKLTGFFLGENKEYVGIMKIHENISLDKIKKMIKEKFTGKITQKPPVKSRVARIEREREIINFEILEKKEKDIVFRAEVQGGTYIRKLIDDLGKELEIGAHMLELRRIRAGIFKEDSNNYPSTNLYDFEKAADEYKNGKEENLKKIIIPGEIVAELYPTINVKKEIINRLFNGSPVFIKDLEKKEDKIEGKVCVFSEDKFIGIYSIINEEQIFAKPEFVLQPIR